LILTVYDLILTVDEKSGTDSEFGNLSTYGLLIVAIGLFLSSYAQYMKKKNER